VNGLVRQMAIGIGWNVDNKGLIQANKKTDGLINNANQAENEMDQLGRAGNTAGDKISRAFDAATNKIKSGMQFLADYRYELLGLSAAGTFGIFKLTSMAGNAQETINKFNVVFGEVAGQTRQWAKNYSDAIGRSEYATMNWLNSFQDVLVPMGLARDEAAGLSQEMVTLAADLGSFNNVPTAEAARAMQSALVGNHEAVRMLGIQLSETQLDIVAQNEGYNQSFRELDNLTKMQLRFQEMIRQSSDAVNDATRTSDEYNNQKLAMKGNLRDLGIAIGNSYIPNMTEGLNVTNDFLDTLIESEWTKPIARVGALATVFAGLAGSAGVVYALAGALGIGAGPIALGALAIAGLVIAFEDLWTWWQGGESVTGKIIDWFDDLTVKFREWENTEISFENLDEWTEGFQTKINEFQNWISGKIDSITDKFTNFEDLSFNLPTFNFDDWWQGINDWFDDNFNIKKIIEEKFDFSLPKPEWVPDWLGWGDNDVTSDNINKESEEIQKNSSIKTENVDNSINIGEIKVEGGNNPEETAKAVKRGIATYERQLAGGVGA
jgi:hypothetical protein